MNAYIKDGIEKFYTKNFKEAMQQFALALSIDPNSKEARIGAILCDMAMSNEEKAFVIASCTLRAEQEDKALKEVKK